MIRILIYDDCEERRDSLQALFAMEPEIYCAGAFPDCSGIRDQIEVLQPDLILMDINMPGVSGINAARLVKQLQPDIKVIMQTVFEDDESIFNSLRAGAEGYLLKNTSGDKIIQSIKDVYEGGAVITPSIAIRVTQHFNNVPLVQQPEQALTAREKEILRLLTEGMSYKMVAGKLAISYNTVNAHVRKIYQKLSVNSVSEAVSHALRNRIV